MRQRRWSAGTATRGTLRSAFEMLTGEKLTYAEMHVMNWPGCVGASVACPSIADISVRGLVAATGGGGRHSPADVSAMTREQVATLAATDTVMAEIQEMLYMTERPALFDPADTRRQLAAAATPLYEVLAGILRSEQPAA